MKIDLTRDCCQEVLGFHEAADELCSFLRVCAPGPEEVAVLVMALDRCRKGVAGAIDQLRRDGDTTIAAKMLADLNQEVK